MSQLVKMSCPCPEFKFGLYTIYASKLKLTKRELNAVLFCNANYCKNKEYRGSNFPPYMIKDV